jgi:hypothetical protein
MELMWTLLMKFSASNLVKRSASQYLYMELNKVVPIPTQGQISGNEYANGIIKQKKACSEKRGIINYEDMTLYFCIDMVNGTTFTEIKQVINMDNYPEWFLQSSILQAVYYATLISKVNILDTPYFMIKQGYENEIITVPKSFNFELWFGTHVYQIFPNELVYKHYLQKMETIFKGINIINYDECREFDRMYKHKEFSIFKPEYKLITLDNNQITCYNNIERS